MRAEHAPYGALRRTAVCGSPWRHLDAGRVIGMLCPVATVGRRPPLAGVRRARGQFLHRDAVLYRAEVGAEVGLNFLNLAIFSLSGN